MGAFAAPDGYIVHGAHLSPVPSYNAEITNFEAASGRGLGIVMYFRPWDRQSIQDLGSGNYLGPCDDGFLPNTVNADRAGGSAKPGAVGGRAFMLTWEPLPILANPGPADYDNVLNGDYDLLINNCADQLKAWPNQVFIIRFMHEMNITTSAWWAGHDYNLMADGVTGDTEKYTQVWRYVWQKFKDKNVTNVQWLWAPNYGSNPNTTVAPWNDMHNYYPGDQYVDWIGLSGYNCYPLRPIQSTYDATLTDLQCRYAKPILHAEIGSTHTSAPLHNPAQSKSAWLADAFTRMQSYPLLRAVTWFNDYAYHSTDHADFRVVATTNYAYTGSTPFSAAPAGGSGNLVTAYKDAIAAPAFTSAFDAAKLLNPPMTRCASDAVAADGVLAARPAAAVAAKQGQTTISFAVGALGLPANTTFSVSCPTGVTCRFASSNGATSATRNAPWSADTLTVSVGASAALGAQTLTISRPGGQSTTVTLTVFDQLLPLYLPLVQR